MRAARFIARISPFLWQVRSTRDPCYWRQMRPEEWKPKIEMREFRNGGRNKMVTMPRPGQSLQGQDSLAVGRDFLFQFLDHNFDIDDFQVFFHIFSFHLWANWTPCIYRSLSVNKAFCFEGVGSCAQPRFRPAARRAVLPT